MNSRLLRTVITELGSLQPMPWSMNGYPTWRSDSVDTLSWAGDEGDERASPRIEEVQFRPLFWGFKR